MWPCGIITMVRELFGSESKSQVYGHIHDYLRNAPHTAEKLSYVSCTFKVTIMYMYVFMIEYICYDDGCHLRLYATSAKRNSQTDTAFAIATKEIVIDKMHMAGHVDAWCKTTCDPQLYPDLEKVQFDTYSVDYYIRQLYIYMYTCRWTQKSVNKSFHGCLDTKK